MTKDKLEQYILDNRDEFDTLEPSEHIWSNIVTETNKPKQKTFVIPQVKWITRIAAAILIFIGSYYFHDYRSQQALISQTNSESNEGSQLYNTLLEAEYYYSAQIGVETEKLYQLTAGNSIVRDEVQNELKELDEEFRLLKEDLKDNADNEDIIAAMIQNYRLKLSILQDMMFQLQEVKKEKETTDEIKLI
jgi:hypothetical protein